MVREEESRSISSKALVCLASLLIKPKQKPQKTEILKQHPSLGHSMSTQNNLYPISFDQHIQSLNDQKKFYSNLIL